MSFATFFRALDRLGLNAEEQQIEQLRAASAPVVTPAPVVVDHTEELAELKALLMKAMAPKKQQLPEPPTVDNPKGALDVVTRYYFLCRKIGVFQQNSAGKAFGDVAAAIIPFGTVKNRTNLQDTIDLNVISYEEGIQQINSALLTLLKSYRWGNAASEIHNLILAIEQDHCGSVSMIPVGLHENGATNWMTLAGLVQYLMANECKFTAVRQLAHDYADLCAIRRQPLKAVAKAMKGIDRAADLTCVDGLQLSQGASAHDALKAFNSASLDIATLGGYSAVKHLCAVNA